MKSHNVSDQSTQYTMTKPPSGAVSHATLLQPRRIGVVYLLKNTFFMIISSHRQGVCTARQAMILLVEKPVCGA